MRFRNELSSLAEVSLYSRVLLTTEFLRISARFRFFAELHTAELHYIILITVTGHIHAALLTSTCPDSSVNIVTRLWAGQDKNHGSSPVACGVFCSGQGQHQLQDLQSFLAKQYWRLFTMG